MLTDIKVKVDAIHEHMVRNAAPPPNVPSTSKPKEKPTVQLDCRVRDTLMKIKNHYHCMHAIINIAILI